MIELEIDTSEIDEGYSLGDLDQASTLDLSRKYLQLMALYNSTGEATYQDLAERIEEELLNHGYQIN